MSPTPLSQPVERTGVFELEDWTAGDRRVLVEFVPASLLLSLLFYRWTMLAWLPSDIAWTISAALTGGVHLTLFAAAQRSRRVRADAATVSARIYATDFGRDHEAPAVVSQRDAA